MNERKMLRVFNKKTDLDAVIKLWQSCSLATPQNNPEKDIIRKLEVDPDLFIVGETNGKKIASCMGGYEDHRGWINYLAVLESHRNQGIGKSIFLEFEKRLKLKGYPKISVQIRSSNLSVVKFYESMGFSDDNVIGMGKRLDNH